MKRYHAHDDRRDPSETLRRPDSAITHTGRIHGIRAASSGSSPFTFTLPFAQDYYTSGESVRRREPAIDWEAKAGKNDRIPPRSDV
jgi:hypothetical protein